jgi:hypothetical protein
MYYTILKVFLTLAWNWPIIIALIFKYLILHSELLCKNTVATQVETMWEAIKLISRLKGLSHKMDLAFDDKYG